LSPSMCLERPWLPSCTLPSLLQRFLAFNTREESCACEAGRVGQGERSTCLRRLLFRFVSCCEGSSTACGYCREHSFERGVGVGVV
jgi:hypothetical protein